MDHHLLHHRMTMRRLHLLIAPFALLHENESPAQNLVPNANFEEMDMPCEFGLSYNKLADWFVVDCAFQPRYFNACDNDGGVLYGVPHNAWGEQEAFSGVAYGGAFTYIWGWNNGSGSYPSVPLTQPLAAGTEYCLSLRASLGGKSTYRSQSLSALLTVETPNACANNDVLNWPGQAQLVFDLAGVDTTNWTLLNGRFTAAGGEQFLTIGNFNSGATIDTVRIPGATHPIRFAGY